jgi:hypothetical protein
MRVYIELPESLLGTLQAQARAAHRPPRYHLEWLLRQVLQEQPADERRCSLAQQSPPQPQEVPCAAE